MSQVWVALVCAATAIVGLGAVWLAERFLGEGKHRKRR